MVGRDELLKILRMKGPVLPVQIAKAVETSILFASAMLAELVSAKIIKVSKVKIGGSPLYYLPEQRSRLQEFSKYLNSKEKEAYELLKNKKVMRELEQEPAIKVALRNIKDYAWPLSVTVNNNKEIFWRWYLLTNEEAGAIIKGMLGVKKEEPKLEPEVPKIGTKDPKFTEQSSANSRNEVSRKPETKLEQEATEEKKEIIPQKEIKPEQIIPHKEAPPPPKPPIPEQSKEIQQKIIKEGQNIKRETIIKKEEKANNFAEQVLGFFSKNNIKVINKEFVRKNEIDFIVELQSAVGNLKYYCKAKAKQRIGDGDLSSAYVQGELKKLPVLFITSGEPTQRAKEMLNKEFQNIVFKKMGRD